MAGSNQRLVKESMEKFEKLISFLKECLQNKPEVADWDIIYDSQTRILIEFIKNQPDDLRILDYGCGELRVLHALIEFLENEKWKYSGYDPFLNELVLDELTNLLIPPKCSYEILTRSTLLKQGKRYDLVILQNVLHEVGIFETAQILQDCRVLLNDKGFLLLLETPLLPKGEPNFVPLYDWEIPMIFYDHKKLSTKSPKGLPILFHSITKSDIPHYGVICGKMHALLKDKQNLFVELAFRLTQSEDEHLNELTHLGLDKIFDYVYLNILIGNIQKRLQLRNHTDTSDPDEVGAEIVKFIDPMENRGKLRKVSDVYDHFSPSYSYNTIYYVLGLLYKYQIIASFKPGVITPTETFDILIERIGLERIRKEGIEECAAESCRRFQNYYAY